MKLRKFVRPFERAFAKIQKENPIKEDEEWLVLLSDATDEKILNYLKEHFIRYRLCSPGGAVGEDDIVFAHVQKNPSSLKLMKAELDVAKIKNHRK
jgi:hypothetical protein